MDQVSLSGFLEVDSALHHTQGRTLLEGLGHRNIIGSHRPGEVEQIIIFPCELHQFLSRRKLDSHLSTQLAGSDLLGTGGEA